MTPVIDGWVIIPNWDRWQSRKDRHDPWIKSYTDLVYRDEYLSLDPTARALLHGVWLLYSLHDATLRASSVTGALRIRARRRHWDSLINAGFINISAAKPPPIRSETAARAREDLEVDKDIPLPPSQKNPKPAARSQRNGTITTRAETLIRNGAWQYTDASLLDQLVDWHVPEPDREPLLELARSLRP